MNPAIKRHIGNLSRAVGHNLNTRYSYIITESELINAYLQMRNDLGYPLMTDSKYRRAIIYNKQGIENKIQQVIAEVITENGQKLANLVVNDVTTRLNSICQISNGKVINKGKNQSSGFGKAIGSAIGHGLVNGFSNILNDITTYDNNRRI